VTSLDDKTRKGIRRTAIVCALVAIIFYLGFIGLGAIR
jgi:hypothetical protein